MGKSPAHRGSRSAFIAFTATLACAGSPWPTTADPSPSRAECELEIIVPAIAASVSALDDGSRLILHPRAAERPGEDVASGAFHDCDVEAVARAVGAVVDTSASVSACAAWTAACRLNPGEAVITFSEPLFEDAGRARVVVDIVHDTPHVRGRLGRFTREYTLARQRGYWTVVKRVDLRVT